MFALIRHDAGASWTVDETVRSGRSLTAALGDVAGFISCALLDTGDGGLVSIAIYEDASGLDEGRRLVDGWLGEHLAPSPNHLFTTVTGAVIVQRGL